jgi:hypothetical protein
MSEPPKRNYHYPSRNQAIFDEPNRKNKYPFREDNDDDYHELHNDNAHDMEIGRLHLLPMEGHHSEVFPELNIAQPGLEKIIGTQPKAQQIYTRGPNGEIIEDTRYTTRDSLRSHFNEPDPNTKFISRYVQGEKQLIKANSGDQVGENDNAGPKTKAGLFRQPGSRAETLICEDETGAGCQAAPA